MKKNLLFIIILTLITCCFAACGKYEGTSEEQAAAQCVYNLRNMMKDPDSFILRGDIIIIYGDETDTVCTYIDHSGNNSFGASVRSIAGYYNNEYVGSIGEETVDASDLNLNAIHYIACDDAYEAYIEEKLSTWKCTLNKYKIVNGKNVSRILRSEYNLKIQYVNE